jgi:hypothetical protein
VISGFNQWYLGSSEIEGVVHAGYFSPFEDAFCPLQFAGTLYYSQRTPGIMPARSSKNNSKAHFGT